MIPDEDDDDLLRAWRGHAQEAPGEPLDRRVLKAAETQRVRRAAVPLAAAMAACLALLVFVVRPQPVTTPAKPVPVANLDTSTFGLYEGREFAISVAPPATAASQNVSARR